MISDIEMRVLDGFELVQLVRGLRPDIKRICISGNTEKLLTDVRFLVRPFLPDQLQEAVSDLLATA